MDLASRVSGPKLRSLSPHAISLTPGPLQVQIPFASLQTLAFSYSVEDRRISHPRWVYPAPGLSQQYLSGLILRGCTIRFILRPAVLAGTPDWVRPTPMVSRHDAVSGQVPPECYHPNAPPAYTPKRATGVTISFQIVRDRF